MVDALDIVGMTTVGGDKSIGSVVLIDDKLYKIESSLVCSECAFTMIPAFTCRRVCEWLCGNIPKGLPMDKILVKIDNGCN